MAMLAVVLLEGIWGEEGLTLTLGAWTVMSLAFSSRTPL